MDVTITERTREEEIMTDYQFKSILKMVLNIAENTDDVEKIKTTLKFLIDGESKSEPKTEN